MKSELKLKNMKPDQELIKLNGKAQITLKGTIITDFKLIKIH